MICNEYVAKSMPDEVSRERVVISRDVRHRGSFSAFAKQFLNDVVVCLRPVPIAGKCPTIKYVPYEVHVGTLVAAQKI